MIETNKHYVDGQWVEPLEPRTIPVIDPATEAEVATVTLGGAADVERAVRAARRAFDGFSQTSREERIALLERILAVYRRRADELAAAVTTEMGAPPWLARGAHVPTGVGHLETTLAVLRRFEFEEPRGRARIVREPIGVCGLITPWNWPLNQILCKVAPALAAGCTMVLKPSETTPLDAALVAEILDEAGVPKGVFNLVHGDGVGVGGPLSAHPDVDMVSFTGSTRAGVLVTKAAADSVKRVTLELGGKSANLLLEGVDLEQAVRHGVHTCFRNSGQSCNAPTRMLVPRALEERALAIAEAAAAEVTPGHARAGERTIGPLANANQDRRVRSMIEAGIAEGARLVCGGAGRPPGFERGYHVAPTVFGGVHNGMTIAREEIFGPVLSVIPYDSVDEAIAIANDTEYGLSAYVQAPDRAKAIEVARRLRAGNVHLNGAPADFAAPFGGYKKSGNGREWGLEGLLEYLEVKAMLGAEG